MTTFPYEDLDDDDSQAEDDDDANSNSTSSLPTANHVPPVTPSLPLRLRSLSSSAPPSKPRPILPLPPRLSHRSRLSFLSLLGPAISSDSIHDLLPKYSLPTGLLPESITSYTLSNNGRFLVNLDGSCYIQFDYVVYYERQITGKLQYDSITDLKGIQVQRFLLWLGMDEIKVDLPPADSVYFQFQVGFVNKRLDVDLWLVACVVVQLR